MNNSYLHLLQISFSNLYKQKNKIKKKMDDLLKKNETKELFKILFKINPELENINSKKGIIYEFLIDNKLIEN